MGYENFRINFKGVDMGGSLYHGSTLAGGDDPCSLEDISEMSVGGVDLPDWVQELIFNDETTSGLIWDVAFESVR